ncbi:hypothetical protein GGX14DRAFT_634694 [Mycena pura]|uniref:Uncharacterized protein n=1 Tax=Mycena pura TaxID=153505 RepID=A0AAD6VF72_9AGAR|nr:hypothetical protein GGX14DRAFT_634694 [Mycena pura]
MEKPSPLSPGAPARKRSSLTKFCLWIGLILAALFVGRIIIGIGQSLFFFTTFSPSHVYQNQTLAEVKNRAAVVRPLVDEKQIFDIAVSIWTPSVEARTTGMRTGNMLDVADTPLYSDIVFRGLRLSDKHKQATLEYQLPIPVFRRLVLKDSDLRASFVVIPTSPSLVDHVKNFSTWYPETMETLPVRSWPFPLGSPDKGPQSVADKALDSFGISTSLLEFHELRTNCAKTRDSGAIEKTATSQDDYDEDWSDDDVEREFDETADELLRGIRMSDIAKHLDHAVKRHPFVVTRTQIRIVDEDHIFNRNAYNKEHNKLKTTSCGQGQNAIPDYHLCDRTYWKNGHWETRLKLQTADEDTGALRTEWAYAPYIGSASFSAGPKDIVPIPVTRVNCTDTENTSLNDPDFITVKWQLSFTGRSPAKFYSTELFSRPERVKHHSSEYKKAEAHDKAELWNGLYGHRFYEDAHPRRRIFIYALFNVLNFLQGVLDLGYWYTRTSTASISVSGAVLQAFSMVLSASAYIANKAEEDNLHVSLSQWAQWLWLIVMTLATSFSLPLFMLKTVTRLEVSQNNSSWFPTVRQVGPTHKERQSRRLDSRTSWLLKAAVCFSLVAIYYLFSPDEYHVLPPLIPPRSPEDHPTNSVARISALLSFPLAFTGNLSQLLLNHRARTFAGSYKLAVSLRFVSAMLALVLYSPALVGRFDARPGFSVPGAVDLFVLAATMWQAAIFPKVVQNAEDEDTE